MTDTKNKGKEVEDLVEKICTKMFFSDFTVRSQKFKNASKQEKEVADILIPFDDTLLAIQVKTKTDNKPFSEKNEVDIARIDNKIDDAIKQFKTVKRAVANLRLKELETTRGYRIPFDASKYRKIIGIVILDLIGEDDFPSDERIAISNGFEIQYDIPIHIFKRDEFEIISSEIDTLPDFIRYIETRETLFSKNLFVIPPFELSLLAMYKVVPEDIQSAIEENSLVIIDDGYWEWYQKDCKELIEKRNVYNRPSYLIDEVINWLHSGVGFDPSNYGIDSNPFGYFGSESQGTIQGYLTVATELAKTPRLIRRKLGEKYWECVERASEKGLAYSLIIDRKNNSGIIILASDKDRTERSKILYSVAVAGYCLQNLTKIVGFATEPLDPGMRSYDVIFLSGVYFEDKATAIENAKKMFGTFFEAKFFEFLNLPDKEIK
jgi:hypothetical protein